MQEIKELEFRLRQEYAPHRGWQIRLIENMLGGTSAALLIFASYTLVANGYGLETWQAYTLIGLIVFSLVNMVRFLRDEIVSIPYLFYRLGVLSQQAKINELVVDNQTLQQQLVMQQTSSAVQQYDRTNSVYQAALKMIKLYYTGLEIDRQNCVNHGIRESEWNPARELLVKAGLVNLNKTKRTELINISYAEAKQRLQGIL